MKLVIVLASLVALAVAVEENQPLVEGSQPVAVVADQDVAEQHYGGYGGGHHGGYGGGHHGGYGGGHHGGYGGGHHGGYGGGHSHGFGGWGRKRRSVEAIQPAVAVVQPVVEIADQEGAEQHHHGYGGGHYGGYGGGHHHHGGYGGGHHGGYGHGGFGGGHGHYHG
ncbi:holotricin-3-like isoform X3 [Daphnia carinata]|uniref:holotricin-3-like isoform X3 n=1 Tax=Daphnia carinata TaxID=120202 RepID=UPI0028696A00|nr:holotricin-3-like isoform X3 [Daphnia carinata]